MSDMLVQLTPEEINSIASRLKEYLVTQGSELQEQESQVIIGFLKEYQSKLQSVEQLVFNSVKESRKTTLERLAVVQSSKNKDMSPEALQQYNNAKMAYEQSRQQMKKDLEQARALELTAAIFKSGYQIINRLREYIKKSKIKYSVAIEGKGKTSTIYEISEEHLMKYLEHDVYRFTQAILQSDQELDFNMRYRASKKRSKEGSNATDLLKYISKEQHSTIWSNGYAVFSAVKQWVADNKTSNPELVKGFGINFGHFLEAYYDQSAGNTLNHDLSGYTHLGFLKTMLSLQNSVEFYRGGDYEEIQLKSNTSTLTNIKTIKSAINDIIAILQSGGNYKKALDSYFSKDNTIENEVASAEIEIPVDLINIINNLGT